jgi:hypothetical protein
MTDATAAPYKNRRGGLIFFGLVELAIGGLCLLLVALTTFGFFVAANAPRAGAPALQFRQMVMSLSVYLLGGALMVSLGIGSILARRWARDLSLVVAWMWMLVGVIAAATMIVMLPRFMPRMPADQAQASTMVLTCVTVVFAFFGVVVPLALILFYRSPNVRATCIALDPHPRWTERVPLPLLALALWTLYGAVTMMAMSAYAVLPLGRQIITGPVAVLAFCALGLFMLYLSWGLYTRSRAAWWLGIAYGALTAIYCVVAFPHLDYDKVVSAMHMPKTPGMPDLGNIYRNPWILACLGFFWLLYFGYFVFVYRYFRESDASLRAPDSSA